MKTALNQPLSLSDLLQTLGADVQGRTGPHDRRICAVADLVDAEPADALSFCSAEGAEAQRLISETGAAVVLCQPDVARGLVATGDRTIVAVADPRLAFIRIVNQYATPEPHAGIATGACVARSARIGRGVFVGEAAVISEECCVGDATRIDAGAILYAGTRIGGRCVVQSGAVIGADGFGFGRDQDGRLHRFPHLGRVVIEDDVEVGARACIDRGALGDTRIGRGTKIDDGAYIAHNTAIGQDCLIMANATLCGSCIIGDRVQIAPGAIVRDKIVVGDDALIGLGAVVVADVGAGATVMGVPARPTPAAALLHGA